MVAPTVTRRRVFLAAVWALFAILAAAAFLLDPAPRSSSTGAPARLVSVSLDGVGAVEIVNAGAYRRFERGADGLWFHHAHAGAAEADASHGHAPDPARSGAIAAALAAFTETPVIGQPRRPGNAERRGLAVPRLFVVLYRPGEDKPLARYTVGHRTPDESGRYVGIDGAERVVIVPEARIARLLAIFDG